jgi:hypothetical protein
LAFGVRRSAFVLVLVLVLEERGGMYLADRCREAFVP